MTKPSLFKIGHFFIILYIFSCVSFLFTRGFDVGVHIFGLQRQSEFLSLIIRLADISLLIGWSYFISKNFQKKSVILAALLLFLSWFSVNLNWLSFKSGFLTEVSVFLSSYVLLKKKTKFLIVLLPYFLFDHVIFTNPLGAEIISLIAWSSLYFENIKEQKYFKVLYLTILGALGINLIIAILQVYNGHSLGLNSIGESYLNVQIKGGIAKQIISPNQILLRGYGLFPHPNFLGLFGVLGLLQALLLRKVSPYANKKFELRTLNHLSIGLIIISFSRMALFSGIIFVLLTSVKLTKKTVFAFLSAFVLILGISAFVFPTRINSDSYRFEQVEFWLKIINQKPSSIIFGLGPGQYANTLKSLNITSESWQNEPIFAPILLVLLEWGLLPLILLFLSLKETWFDKSNLLKQAYNRD